jgi:hypothetical protein
VSLINKTKVLPPSKKFNFEGDLQKSENIFKKHHLQFVFDKTSNLKEI